MELRCTLVWKAHGLTEEVREGFDTITAAKKRAAVISEDGLVWIRRSSDGVHLAYWKRNNERATPHNRDVAVAEIHTIVNLRPRDNT